MIKINIYTINTILFVINKPNTFINCVYASQQNTHAQLELFSIYLLSHLLFAIPDRTFLMSCVPSSV